MSECLKHHLKGREHPTTDELEPVRTVQHVQLLNQHGFCTVQILPQLAADQSWASFDKQSVFIACLCLLSVGGGVPGCPLQLSCPWNVMIAPPRTVAVGCRGSGWTAGAGDCCLLEMPDGCWETPGPTAAGLAQESTRWGGAVPSCCTLPPHRRAERQEVHPPSGPAGLRSAGCRNTRVSVDGESYCILKTTYKISVSVLLTWK